MTTFEQLLQEEEKVARLFLCSQDNLDKERGVFYLDHLKRIKEAYNKQFPNGFGDWAETHHEVVAEIEILLETNKDDLDAIPQRLVDVNEKEGSGGLRLLAIELTDSFEILNHGIVWGSEEGLDWYDALTQHLKTCL
jgi:hypothetical protein